jgi:hypothetical protein
MLFAYKLINRHYTLLNENILSITSPLICVFGQPPGLL